MAPKPLVTQIAIGRFHHFHLARELEVHGMLKEIWSGYPKFKLRDELGIPRSKIKSFPWLHTPLMLRYKLQWENNQWLSREWSWWANDLLDRRVAARLTSPCAWTPLTDSCLAAGSRMRSLGGLYICDRGSTHIRVQDHLLQQEYARWGLELKGIDPRSIAKEEAEYAACDVLTVPSEFARRSFLQQGILAEKIVKIPYGARLARFHKVGDPPQGRFHLLWVGRVSIQKAFLDALSAFQLLDHPRKEFCVVGSIEPCVRKLLKSADTCGVRFIGHVPNSELAQYYSRSHALVLPSIQEGLANVLGEALACGCPIIASPNTGAHDLIVDGEQGFVVPIHSPALIAKKLDLLATSSKVRQQMSKAAIARVALLEGWSEYGRQYAKLVGRLSAGVMPRLA